MMDETAKRVLPQGALTDLNGVSREFRDSQGSIYLTFVLALIFIYLVLAAQFESFADPFVIMLSVPLSMTGALFALWATGGTWNIYSQIGIITLVGLITKHGILIVEFANQLQERGRGRCRGGQAGGRAAAAADPDDHRRDGAGRGAAGAVGRRRRREPHPDRLGDRRRTDVRHAADAVRRADDVHADGAVARQVDGHASPSPRRRRSRCASANLRATPPEPSSRHDPAGRARHRDHRSRSQGRPPDHRGRRDRSRRPPDHRAVASTTTSIRSATATKVRWRCTA